MPTLIVNSEEYKTDIEKATLFADRLSNTFCDSQDEKFNNIFKKESEKIVKNHKSILNSNFSFKLEELNID